MFSTCKCGHVLDVFRYERGEQKCACAVDLDVSINPLPLYMHPLIEDHIRYREDRAVAKFVLEQAERQSAVQPSTT